jgi:hypothetical protein
MTEAEWVACTDPVPMLEFLRGRASDRKLRLFAVACCRRAAACLTDETMRLLEAAEGLAEGAIDDRERRAQREIAMRAGWHSDPGTAHARGPAKAAVAWALARRAYDAARCAASYSTPAAMRFTWDGRPVPAELTWEKRGANERAVQAALLRDIFGPLPFHPVAFPAETLAWNDRLVVRLAQAIYDERRWGDMPLLGDALLDAGCDDEEVLAHCRAGGEHVRGCWVVDLLLGKE